MTVGITGMNEKYHEMKKHITNVKRLITVVRSPACLKNDPSLARCKMLNKMNLDGQQYRNEGMKSKWRQRGKKI